MADRPTPKLGLLLPGPYLGRPVLPAGRVGACPEQPHLWFCLRVWGVAEAQPCSGLGPPHHGLCGLRGRQQLLGRALQGCSGGGGHNGDVGRWPAEGQLG